MGIFYENRNKFCSMKLSDHLGYVAHLHKEIEVVYMIEGKSKAYLDSEEYLVEEGDIFISFPNKVHYYDTFAEEKSYLLIFSPDILPDFSNFLLNYCPESPIIKRKDMPAGIKLLLDNAYYSHCNDKEYRIEILKGYITILLGKVLPRLTFDSVQSNNTDKLASVLAYCAQNYRENISLDSMANDLHTSKYYISRLFGDKIKISFNDYINMLRINDAKEYLIKTDDSITQIGINVGYNTIRSFNRAFLSQTGMQPREFRNLYRNGNHSDDDSGASKQVQHIKDQGSAVICNNSCDIDCCF